MPRYIANVSAAGWFTFTADDEEDAEEVARQLATTPTLADVQLEIVTVDSVQRDD